jgi:hypothetical protein
MCLNRHLKTSFYNQCGSLMIAALLMIAGLCLTVFMAAEITMTNNRIMQNSRIYRSNLYRAQSIISLAAEEHRQEWLNADSDLFDLENSQAAYIENGICLSAGQAGDFNLGRCEIARLEDDPEADSVSAKFYRMSHIAPPAIGSGSSGRMAQRRYGVLATGTDRGRPGKVVLEAGFSRIFQNQG